MASSTVVRQTVDVNGVSLYVEQHGGGDPLVLVHGGTMTSAMWEPTVPLLADRFRVIVVDTRGHGRSTNPSGKLTYPLIADDIAALVEALGLERPVVGGWSDGGQVALEIGMRYPRIARALIAGGVMHDYQGEEFKRVMRALLCLDERDIADCDLMETRQGRLVGFIKGMHAQSPDQWKTIVQQTADMWRVYPNITREALADVQTPTLVISGDRDAMIPLQHTLDFYDWLPNAELAILPGADHMSVVLQPAMFAAVVADYIARH